MRPRSFAKSGWRSSCHSVTSTSASAPSAAAYGSARARWRRRARRGRWASRPGRSATIVAPAPRSCSMRTSAGDSRMSSVSGLNARPQTAMRLPSSVPPKWSMTRRPRTRFWRSLARSTASTIAEAHVVVLARLDERAQVLRKARAAEAAAGEQELARRCAGRCRRPCAPSRCRRRGLGEARQLVHERDAGREHRVGCVLRELGGARCP